MSFADIKTQARRAVHSAFAVPVLFYPGGSTVAASPENPLMARLHNKVQISADPLSGGYAQIVEGVTRVIFDRDTLQAAGIAPRQGDVVEFTAYKVRVRLDTRDTPNGPVTDRWSVNLVK